MAVRGDVHSRELIALCEHWQALFRVIGNVLAIGGGRDLHVGLQEALEGHGAAGSGEITGLAARSRTRDGQLHGRSASIGHLGGHRALPDQLVELELLSVQLVGQLSWGGELLSSRANGLVGLLGVLHLAGVLTWRIRHELRAVELLGLSAGGLDACVGQGRGVRTHISNVAVFVQTLRDAHSALRGKAQLAAGFLLQRRGHKRWVRTARVRLLLNPGDLHAGADQTVSQVLGALLVQHNRGAHQLAGVREIAALRDLLAVDGSQLGGKFVRLSIRRVHLRS